MLSYFPSIYEDELLYSIIARYHKKAGNNSITSTIQEVFGERRLTAVVDFPSNINELIRNLPESWDLTFERIVHNNTFFPLFSPFWPQDRSNNIFELMKVESSRNIHLKAGVYTKKMKPLKYLRFCPKCIEKDEKKQGETYWRRLHQVPGVFICPDHGEILLYSSVLIYGVNPQFYQPANRETCKCYTPKSEYSDAMKAKLVKLAVEIRYLLNNKILSREYEWFIQNYRCVLKEKGLISRKGYVDQATLISSFIEYHSSEFLTLLGLMPDTKDMHNWVAMIARKSKDYPHPIEHVLYIMFLKDSIVNFNEEQRVLPNSTGTSFEMYYPCLNPVADHYMHHIIKDINIRLSRNKNKIATYICSCGFSYSREVSDSKSKDIYRYDTINSYGKLWEDKLRDLVEVQGLHIREIARLMKVDSTTVRKQISKLGFESKWTINKKGRKLNEGSNKRSIMEEIEEQKGLYREQCLELINANLGLSKSEIRNKDTHLFYWLNRYDKEWLNENLKVVKLSRPVSSMVDWGERDEEIKARIEIIVSKLLNESEKPIRITDYRIGKELGITYLLRNGLDKLPLTRKLLESVCEDVDSFRKRRIKSAINKLTDEGKPVKTWIIRQMTGLSGIDTNYIDSTISLEVNRLSMSERSNISVCETHN